MPGQRENEKHCRDEEQTHTQAELDACLAMLEEHNNTTLELCEPFNHQDPRIQYYLDLNRFGRATVRIPTTTMETFIGLLVAAQNRLGCDLLAFVFCRPDSDRIQSTLYGLLREAPTLWTSTTKTNQPDKELHHNSHPISLQEGSGEKRKLESM